MTFPNIFTNDVSGNVIERVNQLTPETQAKWGKMTVDQMLAHCSVTYKMVYEDKHPKPNLFLRLILKAFVKKLVVGEEPYKQNSKTAPAFLIADRKDFAVEKERLIDFIDRTQKIGETKFEGKKSLSFGVLTKDEWNTMFYKHLNHHLNQFGV